MGVVKKYWKKYLEEVWYLIMLYFFVVYMNWRFFGYELDLFQPLYLSMYLVTAIFITWLKKDQIKN